MILSSQCVLSETQKELMRSLVPGLKSRDGTVETQWTVAFSSNNMMRILKGLSAEIWGTVWRNKVRQADFDIFVRCGFFIEKGNGNYSLIEQAIIDSFEEKSQSPMPNTASTWSEQKEWDFFISHASEDKDETVCVKDFETTLRKRLSKILARFWRIDVDRRWSTVHDG